MDTESTQACLEIHPLMLLLGPSDLLLSYSLLFLLLLLLSSSSYLSLLLLILILPLHFLCLVLNLLLLLPDFLLVAPLLELGYGSLIAVIVVPC